MGLGSKGSLGKEGVDPCSSPNRTLLGFRVKGSL